MKHAQPAFNSLPYVVQLRDAGFNEKQSQVLLPIIEQQELKKHDMDQLETKFNKFQLEVTHEFKEVRRDIQELRQEVQHEFKEVRCDIKALRTEFKTENKQLATGLVIKLGVPMVLLLSLFSGFLGAFIKLAH